MNSRLALLGVLAVLALTQFQMYEQKKDLTSLNDKEVDEILKQWDENDEELDPEDLDDDQIYEKRLKNKHQGQGIDLSQYMGKSAEELQFLNKKNQMLIIPVTLYGFEHDHEAMKTGEIWSQSLKNAQFDNVQYYPIDKTQCMFTIMDGANAYKVKEFLIKQEGVDIVGMDSKEYYGIHGPMYKEKGKAKKEL